MNIKSIGHIVLVLTFFFSNALAVHSAEANFWKERRVQSKRHFSSATGAGVQALATDAPGNSSALLLAQLPGAQPVGLNGNGSIPSFSADLPVPPVGEILKSDLTAAQSALTRDGSADWLDPLVNPYGTVREIHLSKKADSPLIIHIQDVHGYVDAQKNIAGMIDGLAKYRGVNLVGMEAAEGAFALEDLRRFPDRDIKERVTNWAIKKDLIGGAEKSGIMAEKPLTLWGVEDTALYQSNVQAVKDSLTRRADALAFHSEWVKNVARLKTAVYSEEMKKYDDNLLAYQDKRRGLGEYLKHLTSQSGGGQAEMAKQFPNTAMLLKALDQEAALDFKQVERERVDLVERLAARLDERTLNGLVKESMAYRAGRVTYGRYYAYVKDLCLQAKIDLTKFPGLTDYIAYVGLSEKINRERLLNELEKLEDVVASRLAKTDLERGVLSLAQDGVLLGKLINNAMTPADWGRYLHRRGEILNLETRGKTFAQRAGIPFDLGIPQDFAEFVHPFEEFCRLALARNDAFADNLFAKMGQDNVKTAVLVTGGFHTEGLLAEIDRRGGSYVVLTPRVEIVQSDKNYLDAFAHDPVPLEKLFDGELISILAARTTTEAAGQSGEVTGPQKIGLAMVAEAVQSWLAGLRGEKWSLRDIRAILGKRLEALLSNLGGVFQKMNLKFGDVSFDRFMLKAQVGGVNYRATGPSAGGFQVALPPIASIDGFENAYNRFARTRFGSWLEGVNQDIFRAIAEIFFAPSAEKPLTINLIAFGNKHGFSTLPLSPLAWIAMLADKKTDWKSVMTSVGGWTAIATVGMAGFSPTIAAFYFTFVDPMGIFSSALGLMLFLVVATINYVYRTDFYLAPHGFMNAIIIGANMILAGLNRFIPQLTFRFARLTLGDLSFFPSRGIDAAAKDKFLRFLNRYKSDPNLKYPNYTSPGISPGYLQLIHILGVEASKPHLQVASDDDIQHLLIATLGYELIKVLEQVEADRPFRPSQTYRNLISGSSVYSTAPGFSPETTGIKISEMYFREVNYPFAQVYDEWIRRCFFSSDDSSGELISDNIRNNDIWHELIDELKNGRYSPAPSAMDSRPILSGQPIGHVYRGPFQIVLSPGDFEIVLNVFSQNDLPDSVQKQVLRENLPASDYYLVRYTKYGNYIMGLNQADGDITIGLHAGKFVTVVETSYISQNHMTVSVKGGKFTIRDNNSTNGLALRTTKKQITERGKQIQAQIEAAKQSIDMYTTSAWDHQNFDTQMTVANHYWGLRMLGSDFFDSRRGVLDVSGIKKEFEKEGVSSETIDALISINTNESLRALMLRFDEYNIKRLTALAALFSAHENDDDFGPLDLVLAREGLKIIQDELQGKNAPGFDLDGNFTNYLQTRFGYSDVSIQLSNSRFRSLLGDSRQGFIFFRWMELRKNLDIAFKLIPRNFTGVPYPALGDNDFESAAQAHTDLWNGINFEYFNFDSLDLKVQESHLLQLLPSLGYRGVGVTTIKNFLLKRKEVESFIAQRRAGAQTAYEVRDSDHGVNTLSYSAPFQIILRLSRTESVVVWVYKRKDLPEKYRNLAVPGDPDDFLLATSFEGQDQVAKVVNDPDVRLVVPMGAFQERKIMSDIGYPTATVRLVGNRIIINVFDNGSVRFGFPVGTQKPEGAQKEISFVIEQDVYSPGEARSVPIQVAQQLQDRIIQNIQNYVGSFSPNDPDGKLLSEFFKRANRLVVYVGRKYTNGRFGSHVDKEGSYIRVHVLESELPVIERGDFFSVTGNEKPEKLRGINYLLIVLKDLERVLLAGERDYYRILGLVPGATQEEIKSAFRQLAQRLAGGKGMGDPEGRALKKVIVAYNRLKTRAGAFALWEQIGLKNLTFAGVLESGIDLLAIITSSVSLAQLGLAALDVTGTIFLILLAGKFLVHFLGGVSQPGDQPAKTLRNTTPLEMFFVALGATWTASKSLVMLPFLAVAFLAPLSAWIAVPLGLAGVLWGTYLHAWSNYLLEVPSLNHVEPASGVAIESYPVDAEGDLLTPDPRANFIGFLKRIAFGGPATPAYGSVAQAIFSVHVKERMGALAANSGSLATVTIEKNPEAWIANQAIANPGNDDSEMEEAMKFYNMAVFFSNRLLALAKKQPEGPLLIEVPSAQELQQNPTTQMALAAVLMAHGASESLKNRPLSLVARGEGSIADGQAWTSKEQVQSAAVEALQKYDPTMALQFAQHVDGGTVQVIHATGGLITMDSQGFRYNLAEILRQTYGNQKYTSALVFGKEAHFNKEGINTIVQDYFDLAARLVESMKGIVLFLTAA